MSLLLFFTTVFSLGGKLALESRTDYGSLSGKFLESADSTLSNMNYSTFDSEQAIGGIKQACQIWVGVARPEGGGDVYFNEEYGSIGNVVFFYMGKIYDSRPTFTVMFRRRLDRLTGLFTASGEMDLHPLFQVAYSPGCAPDEVHELASAL